MRLFPRPLARLTAILTMAVVTAAAAPVREWKQIRIGLDGAYPPFSRVGADGRPSGFDVEVAAAVCAKLAATCETTVLGWDGLLDGLIGHKVDLLVASIPITEATRRHVEFTARYHRIGPRFVARLADPPKSLSAEGLAGRRIGVRAGTVHADHLAATRPTATIVPFPDEAAAGAALARGEIDLVFGDTLALYAWLDGAAPRGVAGFLGDEVFDPGRFGDGAGIAFRREDRDLGGRVDKALAELVRDGTLDRLAAHWFPFAPR